MRVRGSVGPVIGAAGALSLAIGACGLPEVAAVGSTPDAAVHIAGCVRDGGGPTRPHTGRSSLSSVGGRGLAIVECLASTWGVRASTGEVTVWAVLPAPPCRGPGPSNGHARTAC